MMTQNEWQRIPRKLRAALIQIASGKQTPSSDTFDEMIRRDWAISQEYVNVAGGNTRKTTKLVFTDRGARMYADRYTRHE